MCEHGNTVEMELGGRTWSVDSCVAPLVQVLNRGGIPTVASCCGHGKIHGVISLQDGRELVVMSIKEREQHFRRSPHTIHGEPQETIDDLSRLQRRQAVQICEATEIISKLHGDDCVCAWCERTRREESFDALAGV